MANKVTMVKLVSGETVLGKHNTEKNTIEDPAALQTIPTQQGVQMMITPFGYPFDTEFEGEISFDHVVYNYKSVPEDLKTKYLEACSNISLSSQGFGNVDLTSDQATLNASNLLRGK